MTAPAILHMLTPLKHMSPFDVNMAADAGYAVIATYAAVTEDEVRGLVQDAIFSRDPKVMGRTGIFIAGRNAVQALDMLDAAKEAMFPPFQVSVFADPAGSFTTAAAMVATVEKELTTRFGGGLAGRKVVVFGATGVVGFCSGVIAALHGAVAVLVGYDGRERVAALADQAEARFGARLSAADGSTEALKEEIVRDAEIILAAGKAGVQVLSAAQVASAPALKVAADVNAVPPSGIEGVEAHDSGKPIPGTEAVGIGALAIGNVKYKVESGLFRRMLETDLPVFLDFRDAFDLARRLVG
jgi:methylene-tetrahydromethanopterin dehydrogenase